MRIVAQRKRARCVHAHQPIRHRTAARAFVQRIVAGIALQFRKALADRRIRHRGYPQPLHRLFAARLLIDIAKDQFTLARGVGRADQRIDAIRIHQRGYAFELLCRGGQHLQRNIAGQHRQIIHVPLLPAFVHLARFAQGNQMPQRPGDYVFFAVQISLAAILCPQHAGNVPRHGRLFRHDQLFHAFLTLLPSLYQHPTAFASVRIKIKARTCLCL